MSSRFASAASPPTRDQAGPGAPFNSASSIYAAAAKSKAVDANSQMQQELTQIELTQRRNDSPAPRLEREQNFRASANSAFSAINQDGASSSSACAAPRPAPLPARTDKKTNGIKMEHVFLIPLAEKAPYVKYVPGKPPAPQTMPQMASKCKHCGIMYGEIASCFGGWSENAQNHERASWLVGFKEIPEGTATYEVTYVTTKHAFDQPVPVKEGGTGHVPTLDLRCYGCGEKYCEMAHCAKSHAY